MLSWGLPVPSTDDAAEISEAMVRYVHGRMVSEGKPTLLGPSRYSRHWSGRVTDIVKDMSGGTLNNQQASRLGQHISWQIRGNGLGRNTDRYSWELTDLAADRKLGMFNQTHRTVAPSRDRKLDEQVRSQKAKNPPKPITTSFDLALIPTPEATPDSIVEYVGKLTAGYKALQDRFTETCGELATVMTQRDELLEAAKALAEDEWKVAATRIAALVAETGGGEVE